MTNRFVLFLINNKRILLILLITAIIHIILLFFVYFPDKQKEIKMDNTIFKIVDVKEFKSEKENDIVEISRQNKIAENVIETDRELKELETDYLPQHKISEAPIFPEKLIQSKIEYPALANKQGIENVVVILELYIDQQGYIKKTRVLKDPGYGFAEASLKALNGIRCIPAKQNGIPVAVIFRYPIRFKLKK